MLENNEKQACRRTADFFSVDFSVAMNSLVPIAQQQFITQRATEKAQRDTEIFSGTQVKKTAAFRHVHISYTIHYVVRRTAQCDCFFRISYFEFRASDFGFRY